MTGAGYWIELYRRQPLHQFRISTSGKEAVRIVAADAEKQIALQGTCRATLLSGFQLEARDIAIHEAAQ